MHKIQVVYLLLVLALRNRTNMSFLDYLQPKSSAYNKLNRAVIFSLLALFNLHVKAQSPFAGMENLFSKPKSYLMYYSAKPLKIDGKLDEPIWNETPWTENFIDIEGEAKPAPLYRTRVKMLWDDKYLYIASQMEEPHLWANPQQDGDHIFRDNVFKIFIDPDNNMNDDFEIQINPSNLMLFLIMNKPYRDGGVPITGWSPVGLQSGVTRKGTLNNPTDTDTEWIAEVAIPLASLNFNPKDPTKNQGFRINFLRTGWEFTLKDGVYAKAVDANNKPLAPHYAVWTAQGLINMHFPERWGYGIFSAKGPSSKDAPAFTLGYSEKQREYLWLTYYKQKAWFKNNRRYAEALKDLAIPENDIQVYGKKNTLILESTINQFVASIADESGAVISINQDGNIF
jgi:hypothetical protein